MDDTTCPVLDDFDLLSSSSLRDPYPLLAQLRSSTPIAYVPELDHYVVARYEDVAQILGDRDTFAASVASSPITPLGEHAQRILADGGFRRVPTLNNADPPRHGPMRRAVQKSMTPKRMKSLEPYIDRLAQRFVDDLGGQSIADLVATVSFPLPAHVAFELLGFPEADAEQIKEWSQRRVLLTYGDLSDADQEIAAHGVLDFWNYVREFVDERSRTSRDDVTGGLIELHDADPEGLTLDDIVNIVYSLALAGHETTANLITNGVRALMRHRDQWELLRSDRSLIPNAVEEALRFDGPVLIHRRRATVDTELGGVIIPADGKIMLVFGSAHRDAAQFDGPDRFDVTRDDAVTHLSFGKGVHYCLGAPLARTEMRLVLAQLLERLPDLSLAPDDEPDVVPNLHFRSISRLMVLPFGGSIMATSD
jgi:cytochrome P450